MSKRPVLIAGLVAAVAALATFIVLDVLSDEETGDDDVPVMTMHSVLLNEERRYSVVLPGSYLSDPAARYPVLYVLDGQSQAGHTAESAALLARGGVIPEVIVVGISSLGSETRNRDYTPPGMRRDADDPGGETGAADRFLAFLRDELIPAVERDHRTRRPRMLAGWSRGGLFAAWSLIAEPGLFDARFAHSPALWREDDLIATRLDAFLAAGGPDAGYLFLSLGEDENDKMKGSFGRAAALLERRAPANLRWSASLTRGAVHETNARLAAPAGLRGFFSAWNPPPPDVSR